MHKGEIRGQRSEVRGSGWRLAVGCWLLAISYAPLALAANAQKPSLYLTPNDALPVTNVKLPKPDSSAPVAMDADEMNADEKSHIVVASGHVEVMQGESILTADRVTYYQAQDVVLAEGNVAMLQPGGDVYFAERAELKDEMKQAVIAQFKARFADGAVMVAKRAVRANSYTTQLSKASYTPCNICENLAPFWQMNARKATVDDDKEKVTYHDATMEMYGVPMFYTPYLSHPTPDASAKSGFLTPNYATGNANLGTVARVPYYWRIAEDKDLLLTTWLTSLQGPLLQGDYHQLTDDGKYQVRASITDPQRVNSSGQEVSGNELRGHVFAIGDEAIADDTHIGFDLNRASDQTYLRRYGFGNQQSLFTRAYYEQATGNNFFTTEGLSIQGMRTTDVTSKTPLVLPIVKGYREMALGSNGASFHLAGDMQALSRADGVSQRRVSVTPGVSLPHVTADGQVLTATVNLRQDIYDSENVALSSTDSFSGVTARTLPQAALEWRYPLMNPGEKGTWMLEPIALAVVQPEEGNRTKISNEDSRLLELSDTNIFSLNRMPGLDLVDAGSRLAYGFRSHYYARGGMAFDAMFGQSYSFSNDTPFPNSNHAGERFSDYIGRFGAQLAPFYFNFRYALDNQSAMLNRDEFEIGFTKPWLSLNTSFREIRNNRYLDDSREGSVGGTLPLSERWSLFGNATRNLRLDEMVSDSAGLIYKNECFTMMLQSMQNYSSDRDVAPNTTYTFRVGFRNLGEFGGK